MKIRTKLLLSLAAISLFPAVAAYVALNGNSDIAYAVSMSEFEGRQGVLAERLQADLNGIGSAAEETLSETYRIRLDPAERPDANRQREVANTALRVGITTYAADLEILTKSMASQVQETVHDRGVGALDADTQRETEILRELHDSLPILKSNADKLVQLSDAFSPDESKFVQTVLEPTMRGELARNARELATGADQGADEYRGSVGVALRDSYKQTTLIVLFGVAVSVVLAAVISRGVIGPIQHLRDVALRLGQGHLETRIAIESKDEIGELATSFNVMAGSLTTLVGERRHAQDELSEAHERLKSSMGVLESRNREAATLSEMADLLQSCFTLKEASGVIASSTQQLFAGFSGAVYVYSASRNVLEAVTTWGHAPPAERVFSPTECWALRRGRLHVSSTDDGAVRCPHFGTESLSVGLCTPLMAHGETLGILCLVGDGPALPSMSISDDNLQLAISVAEQAALSFANLRLRDKLRHQSVRDPLTGLFNRRYLDESLEREIPNAIRKGRSMGVIMLDVDRFKQFNDMFGHDAGDTVLKELGDCLTKFVRGGDLACRYGGEEFTLILPEASLEDTRNRAEQLRILFQQLSIKHRDVVLGKVTISLGVAALPDHGTTASELLGAADRALLKAKTEGRDRVLVADLPPTGRSARVVAT